MEPIADILRTLLAFLLKFLELLVNFFIQALTLFLDFFRALVGSVT